MKIEIKDKHREHMPLEKNFERVLSPLQDFVSNQSTAGLLLIFATVVAMVMANTQLLDSYRELTQFEIGFIWGQGALVHSAVEWVNEGLIVLFFFLLGLEIKYEILAGELKELKSAMLAIVMAIGGMVFPALSYLAAMSILGGEGWQGWGIAMATDTAFALGLLVLLGARVPKSVLILITALAIVDDMGAVLVISLFYTDNVSIEFLSYGAAVFVLMVLGNALGIRVVWFYFFAGLALWWFISHSGVHATTAGILAALTVPTKPVADTSWFATSMEKVLSRFKKIDQQENSILEQQRQHELAQAAEKISITATTPVQRWQTKLNKPISLLVLPVFAFLNAGVTLPDGTASMANMPIFWACLLGLFLGKPIGIFLFSYVCVRLGWVEKPKDMQWRDFLALGCFAGIGFTMSLFIANLAFIGNFTQIDQAKLGIISGSLLSALVGFAIFFSKSKEERHKVDLINDGAESKRLN